MKIGMTSAILVGVLGAPWAGSANAQDIALGYLPSAAGPFATFSKTNEISAQIAIDEINAGGGIAGKKLRIVAFDTAGNIVDARSRPRGAGFGVASAYQLPRTMQGQIRFAI